MPVTWSVSRITWELVGLVAGLWFTIAANLYAAEVDGHRTSMGRSRIGLLTVLAPAMLTAAGHLPVAPQGSGGRSPNDRP